MVNPSGVDARELSSGTHRIGTGAGVAALFNGRAKQVSKRVVRAFREALPDALLLVSHDAAEALEHARTIAHARPRLVLSGGGDGAAMMLLNLLRTVELTPLPPLGVLRLGTGNAWSRALGAGTVMEMADLLPRVTWPLPTRRFHLLEVEGRLCHFAGVGWDARILNDYKRNLEEASSVPLAGKYLRRLNAGFRGYMASMSRLTVPREILHLSRERPRCTLHAAGHEVFRLDEQGRPFRVEGDPLFEAPVSIAGASTVPEFGYGIRAFPYATTMSGLLNVRVYSQNVLRALAEVRTLWRGKTPDAVMADFFSKRLELRFDRPMPFQIGGDPEGERKSFVVELSELSVDAVDWTAARERIPLL